MNNKILEKLEVKNLGPIKKAKIETKKVNVFIGKNATGKSIIAKLLQVKRENEDLNDYNLDEFIDDKNSFIKYKSNFFKKNELINDFLLRNIRSNALRKILNKKDIELQKLLEILLDEKKSYYIPVERNLVPFFSSYGINLLASKIPLPQYVIEFATEFRLAKDTIKSKRVFDFEYKFESEEDRIYIDNNSFISLKNASSGIQTILPLFITIEYLNTSSKKHYILEESELNLFPKEQFELVKYMIKNSESIIFITHSPYVLYSLNILLYAYKIGNISEKAKNLVEEIIPCEYWINSEDFSANYFKNGEVKSFFNNGIEDNILDDVSIELEEIFDELREIYLKVKK